MRAQSIQVENEPMCGLKLLQAPTEQQYILHHEISCHPGSLLSPEMHTIRSFAAKAVKSHLSELALTHEHNLRQQILDLWVVADGRNMCNG